MASGDGRGAFRGVPFLVWREQRERGGRNIVRREYPLRETGGADDLGPKLTEFTFSVLVMGMMFRHSEIVCVMPFVLPVPGSCFTRITAR